MKIKFKNGKSYKKNTYQDAFLRAFLRDYISRPSCHQCKYANTERVADITLADFWCFESTSAKFRDTDKGISMCMVNTSEGMSYFEKAKKYLIYTERSVDSAVRFNKTLREVCSPNPDRENFWNDYEKNGYEYVLKKYMYGEKVPKWAQKYFVAKRIPTPIWYILKKIMRH
jgi:hypothetical protein